MKELLVYVNYIRSVISYYIGMALDSDKIIKDVTRWADILELPSSKSKLYCFTYLLVYKKEYRNLFVYRVKQKSRLLSCLFSIIWPQLPTLYLCCKNIGGGLFIEHGFATMIAAEKIGEYCWINQQVTIGFNTDNHCPILEDYARVACGAKVLGNVCLGKYSIVGANSVVTKDIPPYAVVGGAPAQILRWLNKNGY